MSKKEGACWEEGFQWVVLGIERVMGSKDLVSACEDEETNIVSKLLLFVHFIDVLELFHKYKWYK